MRPIVALALPTLLSALDLVDRFLLPAFSVDIVAELQLTTLRLQDLVADELRSTMTAATILAMTLVGTSAGNALVGWLADAFRGGAARASRQRTRTPPLITASGCSSRRTSCSGSPCTATRSP
jgi:MFS family permease